MCAQGPSARQGRPRRPAPQVLPDDIFDYADDPTPIVRRRRHPPSDTFDIAKLPVIDDWPDYVPVTEAEVDIFERYFGDILDRLFGPQESKPENESLRSLPTDVNNKP
jgi:hypothetical protein